MEFIKTVADQMLADVMEIRAKFGTGPDVDCSILRRHTMHFELHTDDARISADMTGTLEELGEAKMDLSEKYTFSVRDDDVVGLMVDAFLEGRYPTVEILR